jgi:hypothetical protein
MATACLGDRSELRALVFQRDPVPPDRGGEPARGREGEPLERNIREASSIRAKSSRLEELGRTEPAPDDIGTRLERTHHPRFLTRRYLPVNEKCM